MKAEGVPVSGPAGSVILPVVPEIEQKVTVTPRWPSFQPASAARPYATAASAARAPSISWAASRE